VPIGGTYVRVAGVRVACDPAHFGKGCERAGRLPDPGEIQLVIGTRTPRAHRHDHRIDERIAEIGAQGLFPAPGGTAVHATAAAERDLFEVMRGGHRVRSPRSSRGESPRGDARPTARGEGMGFRRRGNRRAPRSCCGSGGIPRVQRVQPRQCPRLQRPAWSSSPACRRKRRRA
jgi:hypothetical protein